MKKILILIAFVYSSYCQAQPSEGIVHYTRTTYWTKMLNEMTFLSKQERERYTYMYSGRDEWQEYYVLFFNDKASKYTYSDEKTDESQGYDWRKSQFILKRDFEKGTLTDLMEMGGKTYIVEDSLKVPNWKILNELKDIAGHICMKAVVEDTVKKQKIVAWFAQDLPSNAGPERLFGLPGMILALDINNGTVIIEATRIETKKLTQELDLPKKMKGTRMNEMAYQQMLSKIITEKKKEEMDPYWLVRY
jgi:GLPGLI family protein